MKTIKIEKRKRLVAQSARKLFVDKGFDAVSIIDIVTMSGVSTGAIYNYYASKSALARQVYKDSAQEFKELLTVRMQGKETTYAKLNTVAELLLELSKANRSLIEYLFLSNSLVIPREYSPVLGTPSSCLLCRIFEEGIVRGDVRSGDPVAKAVAFWGVVLKYIELLLSGFLNRQMCHEPSLQIVQRAWSAAEP